MISKFDEKRKEKIDNRDNENSFLKDRQKIKYHSFILLEIFPLEKINLLIDGLCSLYSDVPVIDTSIDKMKVILSNSSTELFQYRTLPLPKISDINFKDKILPIGVFYNLGDNIDSYEIRISAIMPSLVVMQIHVHLNEDISAKLNEILYKYHKSIDEKSITTTLNDAFFEYSGIPKKDDSPTLVITNTKSAGIIKSEEIYDFRTALRSEAINFLSNFFKGYFFELTEKEGSSVVPYIDLFSLDYVINKEEISNWIMENTGFFSCFRTHSSFTYMNYLLCPESRSHYLSDYSIRTGKFSNYLLFANRKNIQEFGILKNIDDTIEKRINSYSFELFAISRWLKIQERHVGNFNNRISAEFTNIHKNKLELSIDTRKEIFKDIFQFQRFKAEYQLYDFYDQGVDFYSIANNPETKYFDKLKNDIDGRINDIDQLISIFTKNSDNILNLKNIEYNKNIQNNTRNLTYALLFLAVVQILILIFGEHLRELFNIIFWLIKLIINLII